jgi:hypothetical protein
MNVSDLQKKLALEAAFLESIKAGKVAKDLQNLADGFTPFAEHSIETFFAFLQQAHTYSTTGVLPVTPTKATRAKAPAKVKVDPAQLQQQAHSLYQRVVQLDNDTFAQELQQLNALQSLTKPQLLFIAESLDLFGLKNKKKDELYEQIIGKIANRRGTSQRAEMVFPPQ